MVRLLASVFPLTLAVSCAAPCTTSTLLTPSNSGNLACSEDDAGARVRYRPYNALDESFVDACTGALDGGALEFAVTVRTCAAGVSTGDPLRECTLPALPSGRYVVGERALVVPGDGGFARCE